MEVTEVVRRQEATTMLDHFANVLGLARVFNYFLSVFRSAKIQLWFAPEEFFI